MKYLNHRPNKTEQLSRRLEKLLNKYTKTNSNKKLIKS